MLDTVTASLNLISFFRDETECTRHKMEKTELKSYKMKSRQKTKRDNQRRRTEVLYGIYPVSVKVHREFFNTEGYTDVACKNKKNA